MWKAVLVFLVVLRGWLIIGVPPRVKVRQGLMEGITMTTFKGRAFSAFLGIPYAKPPIGPLRFKRPQPVENWNGVLKANKDGSVCPQLHYITQEFIGDEDCLILNVYSPKIHSKRKKNLLPVIVFIHGGSYIGGSSNSSFIGPKLLLDKNIVLVTLNYRIGALGFLSTGDDASPGNYGLWDQRLALLWVKHNIKAFGGNRHAVTLFGVSAGGACVLLHLISTASKGLFHHVIAHSGTALSHWAVEENPLKNAERLANDFTCSVETTESIIMCLSKVSPEKIVKQTTKYFRASGILPLPFAPVVENSAGAKFLKDHPYNLYNEGKFPKLPIITGIVRDEGLTFALNQIEKMMIISKKKIRKRMEFYLAMFGGISVKAVTKLADMYMKDLNVENLTDPEVKKSFIAGISDGGFRASHQMTVKFLSQHGSRTYLYCMDHIMEESFSNAVFGGKYLGVAHGDDTLLLFNGFYGRGLLEGQDKVLSENVIDMWTNFAKHGDPIFHGKQDENKSIEFPSWYPVVSGHMNYLSLQLPLEMKNSLPSSLLRLWNRMMVQTEIEKFKNNLPESSEEQSNDESMKLSNSSPPMYFKRSFFRKGNICKRERFPF